MSVPRFPATSLTLLRDGGGEKTQEALCVLGTLEALGLRPDTESLPPSNPALADVDLVTPRTTSRARLALCNH